MPRLLTVAVPMTAAGALLAPNCGGCEPPPGPPPQNTAMVWVDQDDPSRVNQDPSTQPVFALGDPSDPTTMRIWYLVSVDPDASGQLSDDCALWIEEWAGYSGEPPETECLYVGMEVEVGTAEPEALDGFLGPITRPDGRLIDIQFYTDPPVDPGTAGGVSAVFAGGQPGSSIEWYIDTVSGDPLYDGVYEVPPASEFEVITWDVNGSI